MEIKNIVNEICTYIHKPKFYHHQNGLGQSKSRICLIIDISGRNIFAHVYEPKKRIKIGPTFLVEFV